MGSERSQWLGDGPFPRDPAAPAGEDSGSLSGDGTDAPGNGGGSAGDDGTRDDGTTDFVTAIIRAEEEAQARKDRLRSRRFLPSEEELLREVEEGLAKSYPPPPASEQVSVRLQPAQWKRLLIVSEKSGMRPTTMARLLINRGARAIIDEELRWRAQFDDRD